MGEGEGGGDGGVSLIKDKFGKENKDGGKTIRDLVGLNRKPFFEGPFTQILIETDELEASRRFLGPYEGCRKLQGVPGSQRMNGQKPLCP